jgi:hypothetical protein
VSTAPGDEPRPFDAAANECVWCDPLHWHSAAVCTACASGELGVSIWQHTSFNHFVAAERMAPFVVLGFNGDRVPQA